MRLRNEPPPEMYADEPVLLRTGPHWMSQDILFALAAALVAYTVATALVAPELTRFAIIPAVPLLIRLAFELPRFWRFEIVLTPRRLILNVGTVRDVYHTLRVRDMRAVAARSTRLGTLLGYGGVDIVLETPTPDGKPVRGAYSIDYVRGAKELSSTIRGLIEPSDESARPS